MTAYFFTPLQVTTPWKPGATFVLGAYFELTTGLALGDTITFSNAITPSGTTAIELLCYTSQLDSNATPLGAYKVGDSTLSDANAPGRFITGGKMGSNVAGAQVVTYSNVAPAFVSGVQTVGVGYNYFNNENTTTNESNGYMDLIFTVTTVPSTAAATGTVWLYYTYYCVGTP